MVIWVRHNFTGATFIKWLWYLILLFFLHFLYACNKDANSEKQFSIGFSQCISDHDWRKAMEKEMEQELYFHNDIRLKKLDAKGSTSLQKEQIRTLIKEKVDLLIISPLEAKPLVEEVELAHSLNIPTILLDRKVETDKYTTFIGADNYEIGYQAGTYIKNKFGTGNILEIWGLKGSSPAMERHKGFHEGIKNSKLIVSTEIHLPLENESFLIDKKPLLSKLNNIDLVFGHTDAITFNSYKIIKETQEEPKISFIGIDGLFGENLGIDLVERGILSAT
ncbi:MAG: substrate-binding domain-containing protein, partial [Bacteroidota bacterium]